MTDWSDFPTRRVDVSVPLWRIHRAGFQPAWFNHDGDWRFDPPASHRSRFGVCYLGVDPLASYVEVFGRIRLVPQSEIDQRRLSELRLKRHVEVADLTERSILGTFGVTAAHSAGTDYQPSQTLAADLYDAGVDGVFYRVRHDPAMQLEAVALFGDPGEQPDRFQPTKPEAIPRRLIERGEAFSISVAPSSPLP